MKQYYESEVLFQLMERDGFNIPSSVPPYEAEIKAYLINQVKQAYPKLTDYEAEWLLYNYTKHLPAEFPISSVTNATSATFENVVPFAYQSAILKGQTLVNVTSNKKIVGSSYIRVEVDNNLIKPNVQYTLIVNGYSNVSRISCVDNNGLNDYFNIANPKQWNIFTTPNDLTNHHIRVYGTSIDDTLLNSIDIILVEGDYTNINTPYFTGMQSVKMPVLTTVGKNLFNSTFIRGNRLNETGVIHQQMSYMTTADYINIKNVDSAIASIGDGYRISQFFLYDDNGNFISINGNPLTNTANATKCHITIAKNPATEVTDEDLTEVLKTFQLEQGSVATPYEPYKSNILTVNEEVTLRGIGEVQDELNCLTGELTQRIGEVVLDGSEEYASYNAGAVTVYGFVTSLTTNSRGVNTALCDKLPVQEGSSVSLLDEEGIFLRKDLNVVYLKISKSKLSDGSISALKTWLAENNITFSHLLKENVIKTVDLTTVNENGETTHFMPLEGTMNVQSSGEIIQPTFDMTVPVEATTQNLASFIDLEMEE